MRNAYVFFLCINQVYEFIQKNIIRIAVFLKSARMSVKSNVILGGTQKIFETKLFVNID